MVILRSSVPGLSELALSRFAAKASRAVRLRAQPTLLITSNREMKSLNRRFRGKDKSTDVLSFPATTHFVGQHSGDVAISAQIAISNAHDLGHSAAEEVKILVLHGILHLAGYDHEADNGKMARKERQLRKLLNLPSSLIERSDLQKPARSRPHRGRNRRSR
jgi:probable rRNA maturation factor